MWVKQFHLHHPPVITISIGVNRSQSWVVFDIALPTFIMFDSFRCGNGVYPKNEDKLWGFMKMRIMKLYGVSYFQTNPFDGNIMKIKAPVPPNARNPMDSVFSPPAR